MRLYRPNLINRTIINNKITDIIVMIFTFIIFVTTMMMIFTSCNKKDQDNIKPSYIQHKYKDGDLIPNYNIDTLINGIPCRNLEDRNNVRLIKPALNKNLNLTFSLYNRDNYYYRVQKWSKVPKGRVCKINCVNISFLLTSYCQEKQKKALLRSNL